MFSTRSRRIAAVLLMSIIFTGAAPVRAAITVLNYWRMGESDPGAANNGICLATTDIVASVTLSNFSNGRRFPYYSSSVSDQAAADTGSSLGLVFSGGQIAKADALAALTNNFGIEALMYPATNQGGAVVVYNGDTGAQRLRHLPIRRGLAPASGRRRVCRFCAPGDQHLDARRPGLFCGNADAIHEWGLRNQRGQSL